MFVFTYLILNERILDLFFLKTKKLVEIVAILVHHTKVHTMVYISYPINILTLKNNNFKS